MDFLDHIIEAKQIADQLKGFIGAYPACVLGLVTDNQDPLSLGRVKAALPSKGAKTETDWLLRVTPYGGLSFPVPQPGDLIEVGFIDGDPHKGVYRGVVHNLVNPQGEPTQLTLRVGAVTLAIAPEGTVSFSGVTDLTINGKSVTVLGAADNTGDTLATKGY